jgi:pimeloyl-ACP methyl ester carboxylesterase
MPRQVVILHGWSDDSRSFKGMAAFLRQRGWDPVPLWLGDYLSRSDHVKIEDVVKRMDAVLAGPDRVPGLHDSFDMIVHSTGGLVARRWVSTCYPSGEGCPVKRLVMVAPANFGSKLASTGKSPIGRIIKGWKRGGEVGTEVLTALELASDFQWDLAQEDLFVPEDHDPATAPSPYGSGKVWPFVIVGSHPYLSGFRQVVNEDGSDGTVRVPAANLNAYGATVDLRRREDEPGFFQRWPLRHEADQAYKRDGRPKPCFPFAVLPDRDHGTITRPGEAPVPCNGPDESKLDHLLLEALNCPDGAAYRAIADRWEGLCEDTHNLAALGREQRRAVFPRHHRKIDLAFFHQYVQVVVRVEDDHGSPVDDYYIEFFHADQKGKAPAVVFHREVLEDVHPGVARATRCFYIDRTDLMRRFYGQALRGKPDQDKTLNAMISAARPGRYVHYLAKDVTERKILAHCEAGKGRRFLRRNCTHFLKIVVPRNPEDRVFRLSAG